MTIQELFDEYRQLGILNSGSNDETYEMYSIRRYRMNEIIQEIEALVRKETIDGIINCGVSSGCIYYDEIEEYAQSKGIIL